MHAICQCPRSWYLGAERGLCGGGRNPHNNSNTSVPNRLTFCHLSGSPFLALSVSVQVCYSTHTSIFILMPYFGLPDVRFPSQSTLELIAGSHSFRALYASRCWDNVLPFLIYGILWIRHYRCQWPWTMQDRGPFRPFWLCSDLIK
jgi:hypothetical protein